MKLMLDSVIGISESDVGVGALAYDRKTRSASAQIQTVAFGAGGKLPHKKKLYFNEQRQAIFHTIFNRNGQNSIGQT